MMGDPFPLTEDELIAEAEDMLDSDPKELDMHMLQLRLMLAILKRLKENDHGRG